MPRRHRARHARCSAICRGTQILNVACGGDAGPAPRGRDPARRGAGHVLDPRGPPSSRARSPRVQRAPSEPRSAPTTTRRSTASATASSRRAGRCRTTWSRRSSCRSARSSSASCGIRRSSATARRSARSPPRRCARRCPHEPRGHRARDGGGHGGGAARGSGGGRRGRGRGEGGVPRVARGGARGPGDAAPSPLRMRSSAESEDLATLEARNAGKPISDARGEIGMVAECFRYYAAAPERLVGRTIPVAGGVDMTFREPMGVVGLIVPWNFPLVITLVEDGSGAGRGQHGRPEARRADAAHRNRARADRARGGSARGRPERRRRPRLRLRTSAWSSIPTSRRSPSPARPRSGGASRRGRRGRSSG